MTQPNMSAEDLDKLEEVSEAYKKYPRSTATFCKYIAPKLDDLIALAREHQQRSQAVEVYQKVGK